MLSARLRVRPWAAILGEPYDGVSCAPRWLCEVEPPVGLVGVRMAAFVEWAAAAAPALGREPGDLARACVDSRAAAVRQAIEDNPLAKAADAVELRVNNRPSLLIVVDR